LRQRGEFVKHPSSWRVRREMEGGGRREAEKGKGREEGRRGGGREEGERGGRD
jgi:hypothetical protein